MIPIKPIALISLILGLFLSQTLMASSNRVALVIGNSAYSDAPLKNPVNDARLVAKNLKKLGFKVILKTNASQESMADAIGEFGQQLKQGSVGLFFYAGHGIQSRGSNYLIPVDSKLKREAQLKYNAIDAGQVLEEMRLAGNSLNIVILDACRNNPLTRSFRSAKRGLARIDDVPRGTLLAYSTSPGDVAADGDGRNSPYTLALVNAMKQQGQPLELVFKEVTKGVQRRTRGEQLPWMTSSVMGDFYFIEDNTDTLPDPIQVASADPDMASKDEREFWSDVQSDPGKVMYEAYLADYPSGKYATRARIKLKKYQTPAKPDASQQLSTCKAHINANRLTSGRGGNALECYEQILSSEPNNSEALSGLQQIEAKYVLWAKSQINKGRYNKAKAYLKKIALINPESAQLRELEEQLSQKEAMVQQNTQPVNRPRTRTGSTSGARSLIDSATGMKLLKIPNGCFQMGSNDYDNDEKPVHKVCITKPFYMGKYEVTQGQWQAIMGNNPSKFKKGNNYPVETVSWNDVQTFIKKLNQKTGKSYRLPTEAEWEYAARAGTKTKYSFGNNESQLSRYGNFCDSNCGYNWKDKNQNDGYKTTAPVGKYKANEWGLYDIHGNVWEWTCSLNSESYNGSEKRCGSGSGKRSLRGGSWGNTPFNLRSANRLRYTPGFRYFDIGFRLALP